jgi:pyruvate carboxylase subunit B
MKYLVSVGERQLEVEVNTLGQAEATVRIAGKAKKVELKRVGQNYVLLLEGRAIDLGISGREGHYYVQRSGQEYEVRVERALLQKYKQFLRAAQGGISGAATILAPMPGLILKVEAEVGQHVKAGEKLLIIDAMKMENEIRAPSEGIVEKINVQEKQQVEKGHLLCTIRKPGGGS